MDATSDRRARFHFGTISLIREPARSAALQAVKIAREAGLLISFDPNLRLNLWPAEKRRVRRCGQAGRWPM